MVGAAVESGERLAGRDVFILRQGCAKEGRPTLWLVIAEPTLQHFGTRINTVLAGGQAAANCEYSVSHRLRRVSVRTTRQVVKGEELRTFYSEEYCRQLRQEVAQGEAQEERDRLERLEAESRDAGGRFVANPWRTCRYCENAKLPGDDGLRRHLNLCGAFKKVRKLAPFGRGPPRGAARGGRGR